MQKKSASGITLTLLLTALFLGVMMPGDVWAHVPGILLSSWSLAPPNIDGIVSPTDWASADTIPFTTFGGILPGRTGTLHVMNDATNLYIAVAVPDTSPDLSDLCYLYFDNDHDGIFEIGDDSLRIYGVRPVAVPQFEDLHWNPDVPGWTEDWYPAYGIYGTFDGSGDASHIDGVNYFEFSHPLNSTDNEYDFSLSQGDTVGFALGYYDDGSSVGWFPGIPGDPEDYGDINIASPPRTWTVDDDGPADFHTIQEAIDAANSRDTVHVLSGTYYENVDVTKSLSIQSRDTAELTIVQAANPNDHVFDIEADYVSITGFSIRGASGSGSFAGICLFGRNFCNISANILHSNRFDILVSDASHNTISNNSIHGDGSTDWNGIFLDFAYYNTISNNSISSTLIGGLRVLDFSGNNTISDNVVDSSGLYGIDIIDSSQNIIRNNHITNNGEYGLDVRGSSGNTIYHNSFVNNVHQVRAVDAINIWDDGYPSGGNYWSDYSGVDLYYGADQDVPSRDGIGDTPYVIDSENRDRYPLMDPWIERKVGVQVGDWAKYGDFVVEWSSNDPSANPPSDYEFWRSIDWTKTMVEAVSGTTITFEFLIHFKDGTEQSNVWDIDIDTGVGFPFYFISANLAAGYTTYAGGVGYSPGPKINETIPVQYLGTLRETNHLTLTRFYEDYFGWKNYWESYDFYWDRATGVQAEYSYQRSFETGTEAYLTAELTSFRIVDTNLWGTPTPPTIKADANVDPHTLNLGSKGKWVTAYIQLPDGYNPADINTSTIMLNGTVAPVLDPKYDFVTNSSEFLVDHNGDGVLERMVKFDRTSISTWIYQSGVPHEVSLTITGELTDGTPFEGTATISVAYFGGGSGRHK